MILLKSSNLVSAIEYLILLNNVIMAASNIVQQAPGLFESEISRKTVELQIRVLLIRKAAFEFSEILLVEFLSQSPLVA